MSLFAVPEVGVCILALGVVLGLVMGSAVNCLAMRMAAGQKWSSGRSRCPVCGHELAAGELIPLVSWLVQRGQCRHCGAAISKRYPLTEAGMAVLYAGVLVRFGLSWDTLSALVLVTCLMALSLVDLDTQEIPHVFLIVPAVLRLVQLVWECGFTAALWSHVWPALALGGAVLVLSLVMDKVLGRESMGGGDIKLLFLLGLFMDFPCCILLVIVACIVGLTLAVMMGAHKGVAFPFGPAIAAAAWLVLMIGEPVTTWYLGLFWGGY